MSKYLTCAALAGLFLALGHAAFAGEVVAPPPVKVPEPATIALLASGVAGLISLKRLRRSR